MDVFLLSEWRCQAPFSSYSVSWGQQIGSQGTFPLGKWYKTLDNDSYEVYISVLRLSFLSLSWNSTDWLIGWFTSISFYCSAFCASLVITKWLEYILYTTLKWKQVRAHWKELRCHLDSSLGVRTDTRVKVGRGKLWADLPPLLPPISFLYRGQQWPLCQIRPTISFSEQNFIETPPCPLVYKLSMAPFSLHSRVE